MIRENHDSMSTPDCKSNSKSLPAADRDTDTRHVSDVVCSITLYLPIQDLDDERDRNRDAGMKGGQATLRIYRRYNYSTVVDTQGTTMGAETKANLA